MNTILKRCPKCGRELDSANFYKSKLTPDGLGFYCKECMKRMVFNSRSAKNGRKQNLSQITSEPVLTLKGATGVQILQELKSRGYTWDNMYEPRKKISFESIK